MDARQDQAFAMFDRGDRVNTVAKALYKGNWGAAKKVKAAWDAARGGATSKPEADTSEADGQDWEVAVTVPGGRIKDIFHAFSEQEQINAIQRVLQDRLNLILDPPAEEEAA
jgi:hypothetical protein